MSWNGPSVISQRESETFCRLKFPVRLFFLGRQLALKKLTLPLLVCTVITTKQSEQKIWENGSDIMEINAKMRFALQNLQ